MMKKLEIFLQIILQIKFKEALKKMTLEEKDSNIRSALVVYNSNGMVLIEHALGRPKKAGNWDLPKGHFDPTIDIKTSDTAIRECKEETGLIFEESDISLITTISYYGDELQVFILNKPYNFKSEELYCVSKIGPGYSQKWKIGLPEVDDYIAVPVEKIDEWLYKEYNKAKFLDPVIDWVSEHI